MAAEITDDHLATFCVEARWDDLAGRLTAVYGDIATRLVLYDTATATPERFERYGEIARALSAAR